MTDTTRKRLPEEQVSIEKEKQDDNNKIPKTEKTKSNKLTHDEIHKLVMEMLRFDHIRGYYEKQGDPYDILYQLYLKPTPKSMSCKLVDGKVQCDVYDEDGNIMDPNDPNVKYFMEKY